MLDNDRPRPEAVWLVGDEGITKGNGETCIKRHVKATSEEVVQSYATHLREAHGMDVKVISPDGRPSKNYGVNYDRGTSKWTPSGSAWSNRPRDPKLN